MSTAIWRIASVLNEYSRWEDKLRIKRVPLSGEQPLYYTDAIDGCWRVTPCDQGEGRRNQLTFVNAFIVRWRKAASSSAGIAATRATQLRMHSKVCLGPWIRAEERMVFKPKRHPRSRITEGSLFMS